MPTLKIGDMIFEQSVELIDVTSSHRPDMNWRFVDAAGHLHQWEPPGAYRPEVSYLVPTTVRVVDDLEAWFDDDGEPHCSYRLVCAICGETVNARYMADTDYQYIPGRRSCSVNGRPCSPEEFHALLAEARSSEKGGS